MSRIYLLCISLLLCGSAQAQMSLSDQINAVNAAQESERARQLAIQRAASEQVARAAAQQQAAQLALEKQRLAAQKVARDEATVDKLRNQNYEDRLRALQIEHAK